MATEFKELSSQYHIKQVISTGESIEHMCKTR